MNSEILKEFYNKGFFSKKVFDIVSIAEGKVISITQDDIVGTTIKIEHNNNLISVYQSVKDVEVKPYKKICYGKIKFGKEKKIVRLENISPEEEEIYQTPYGKMNGKTLLEISISTGVRIYEMM